MSKKIKIEWKPEDFAAAEAAKRLGEILGEAGDDVVKAFEGIARNILADFERGLSTPWRDPIKIRGLKIAGADAGKTIEFGYGRLGKMVPTPLSEDEERELEAAGTRFGVYVDELVTEGMGLTAGYESSEVTFEKMMQVIEEMGGFKPVAQGMWFVDCPAVYIQFCNQVEEMELASPMTPGPQEERVPQDGRYLAAMSMPVVNFQKEAMGEGEIIAERGESAAERAKMLDWEVTVWPWFCRYPGVWVEMSDGNHKYYVVIAGRMVRVDTGSFLESETYQELIRELGRPSEKAAAEMERLGMIVDLMGEEE